jgi:hypothetical protein
MLAGAVILSLSPGYPAEDWVVQLECKFVLQDSEKQNNRHFDQREKSFVITTLKIRHFPACLGSLYA